MNRELPNTWKHAVIQRIPKKNFDRNDLLIDTVKSIFTLFMQPNNNLRI